MVDLTRLPPAEMARHLGCPDGEVGLAVTERLNRVNANITAEAYRRLEPDAGMHVMEIGFGNGHSLPDLLRQSIYSRLAGYEDVNDAERLSQDPTFRLIGSEKIWERGAALPSRLHWFETEVLSQNENLEGLSRINRELLAKAEAMDSPQRTVLDMDSTEIPVYGEQEHSAYNGHFESTCYHPLLLFNGEGYCLGAKLRPR